jgi:hypothetical protein
LSERCFVTRSLLRWLTFTAKIIFDAISQWHPAINRQKPSASEATVASTEDDMGVLEKDHHQGQRHTSEVGRWPITLRQGAGFIEDSRRLMKRAEL